MQAQTITTITGTGVAGYSGDGGAATLAKVNHAWGVYIDNSNNIYFSEDGNYTIRKIDASHTISTIAGTGLLGFSGDGGPATAAQINHAGQIITDAVGNIYFTDSYNNRVRKINTAGVISTIAGNGTPGFAGDGAQATAAKLFNPLGIAIDRYGNLYISDFSNNRVRKINTSGIITTFAGNGTSGYSGDGGAAISASLHNPNSIAIDTSGNIYVTDNANHCIRKINTSGIISTYAGNGVGGFSGDGGPATSAQLHYPAGIATDTFGNIYISDYSNSRLRKVNPSGIISTIAGTGIPGFSGDGGPASAAQLNNLTGVACGNNGSIYICDYNNNRVRMMAPPDRSPSFLFGPAHSIVLCEGEGVTSASLDSSLAITDSDVGQTEIWSLTLPPSHGTASTAYTATSTGGLIIPAGLTYAPAVGYVGTDSFKVSVTDGYNTTQITINITVDPYPYAGIISGIDSICPGHTTPLSETVTGGIWSTSSLIVATISPSGVVNGLYPGRDTIIYTVINSCGIVSAIFPFTVRSFGACHTGITTTIKGEGEGIKIFPNPNKGIFTIRLTNPLDLDTRILITDVLGNMVHEFSGRTNEDNKLKLDAAPGMYIISVTTSSDSYFTKMIITY